eukprot:5863097-Prymnesium_polylepis.1
MIPAALPPADARNSTPARWRYERSSYCARTGRVYAGWPSSKKEKRESDMRSPLIELASLAAIDMNAEKGTSIARGAAAARRDACATSRLRTMIAGRSGLRRASTARYLRSHGGGDCVRAASCRSSRFAILSGPPPCVPCCRPPPAAAWPSTAAHRECVGVRSRRGWCSAWCKLAAGRCATKPPVGSSRAKAASIAVAVRMARERRGANLARNVTRTTTYLYACVPVARSSAGGP